MGAGYHGRFGHTNGEKKHQKNLETTEKSSNDLKEEVKTFGGKIGYERDYYYNGNYFVFTGIDANGFIVSAYPLDNKTAQEHIRRYKK